MKISIVFAILMCLITGIITYGLCHMWDGVRLPIISRTEYYQLLGRTNQIDQYLGSLIQQKVLPQVRRE